MKNILIIGSGAYGTALATVLSDNKHNVKILGIDNLEINDININNRNSKYFPDIKLNKTIKAFSNWEIAVENIEVIVLAIPSHTIPEICVKINKYVKNKVGIINAAKGFANPTEMIIPFDELKSKLKPNVYEYIGGIYGPSIASEVMNKKPVFIAAVSDDINNSNKISSIFKNDYFSVYSSEKYLTTEYSVILKNIYAIATGMTEAIFKSNSTLASLIAISISEIRKIITIYRKFSLKTDNLELASLADIILTTSSNKSRNFTLGYKIGEVDNAKEIIDNYPFTVEGLKSCKLLYNNLSESGNNFPLLTILYEILFNNKKPSSFLASIFNLHDW